MYFFLWIRIKHVFSDRFLDPDKCPDLGESCVLMYIQNLKYSNNKLHNLKQTLYFDIIQFCNNTL